MEIIPAADLKAALKQCRTDVPSVGTINYETVEQFLAEGRICRGWTEINGQPQYFFLIKSPGSYPEKSVFTGNSEKEVFQMIIHLGMQHEIDLNDLLTD